MKPPPFQYVRPGSIDEAVKVLTDNEGAKILAGGQSLIAMMNLRAVSPPMIVDINGLTELDYIKETSDQILIGALTRHNDVKHSPLVAKHCPLLAEAYNWIAHQAVRNRGTIGGNVFHADPASENPAVLLAYDAVLVLRSSNGEREVLAGEFFDDIYEVTANDDELLTEIRIHKRPKGEGCGFFEVSSRKGDFAIVAIGAVTSLVGGKFGGTRIVASGVGPTAQRIAEAESILEGNTVDGETIRAAAEAASKAIDPFSDYHADADYRRDLTFSLTRRAVDQAVQQASS